MRWRRALWGWWAAFFVLLLLGLAIPGIAPSRQEPWYDAQKSVAGFVLTLLSLVAGVGTFTLRESLVQRDLRRGTLDPGTPAGFARVRAGLLALWTLCLVIGLMGCALAYGAGVPRAAWPYAFAAGVLLVFHAPRSRLFATPPAVASDARGAPDAK